MQNRCEKKSRARTERFKIDFRIEKALEYGQAMYVVGSAQELGGWKPSNALRLNWNEVEILEIQGHKWTGSAMVPRKQRLVQFKYLIADWGKPDNCIWEEGSNRKLTIQLNRNSVFCNHIWNLQRITLYLLVPQTSTCQYYVIGNTPELGAWKDKKQLALRTNLSVQKPLFSQISQIALSHSQPHSISNSTIQNSFSPSQLRSSDSDRNLNKQNRDEKDPSKCEEKKGELKLKQYLSMQGYEHLKQKIEERKQNELKRIESMKVSENIKHNENLEEKPTKAYSIGFYLSKARKNIHYYYIRKEGGDTEAERQPGRFIDLNNLQKRHPECQKISHIAGDLQIFEICAFVQLHFSQINQRIVVGAYPRTMQDFLRLKQYQINAVLSIQSKEDYNTHCLSAYYLELLCADHNINYHTYSIIDQDHNDFVEKAFGAFLLLRKLVDQNNRVYVHCSAGIYRSPQLIVVYLVLVQGYRLTEAIGLVTSKHPFARINYALLTETLTEINKRMHRLASTN